VRVKPTSTRLGTAAALTLALAVAVALAPSPARAARARRLGAVAGTIQLIPTGTSPIEVRGMHGYFGSIELDPASDGLVVSNRLSLEKYLRGLAEVPSTWPEEALKAQAVAARTYALYTLSQPRAGMAAVYDFDICASVQCQVYMGADAGLDARWSAAVANTAGVAVLYSGEPILARYHSTSGGRTLDNPEAFPEEPSYPYLRSVPSPTEEGSPLFRWIAPYPLRDLQEILERAGWWSNSGRLMRVRTVESRTGLHYPDVLIIGRKGRLRTTAEALRTVLRDHAPALFPSKYPSRAPTSSGRLPEALPSNRYAAFTRRKVVTFAGRGWGHGVGMSQWGAHGLALRGANYADILANYYTGVEIGTVSSDRPIEVGVGWGLARVDVAGEFRIANEAGRTLVRRALGTWSFEWDGGGAVSIDPPRGYGLPLEIEVLDAPRRVEPGEVVSLAIALSRPASVRTVTEPTSSSYEDRPSEPLDGGRRRVRWRAPRQEGTYTVGVGATTERGRRVTEPVRIEVSDGEPGAVVALSPSPATSDDPGEGASDTVRTSILVALGLVGLAVAFYLRLQYLYRRDE
jgi:stage II sporulation protein D